MRGDGRPTLYFDLGSPYAYLAAERVEELLSAPVRWQPISLGGLFKLTGRSSWSLGDPERRRVGIAEVERRASSYGLPPLRWPDPWPGNYLTAMRAAIYAQRQGLAREFATRAFESAFQRGHDLSDPEHVLAAAAEVGLERSSVEQATGSDEIKLALREATDVAYRLGVIGVPAIAVGRELFWGDDRLQEAAASVQKQS
ncbi:MAG TPA: 2-hydroxychromene-2-carboxylate isomerase [Solirubrobacteraceae bacterium]|jgi:2-hydroxychromene-2-carboxylate isomerase|nr:2-hydroxychromene-2-carboxylate isomerase [Solirubrobacteraceae bacterium]